MENAKQKTEEKGPNTVQVKICGLTRPAEAAACAEAGADAIGLVFFPKSPRNVDIHQARAVCREIGSAVRAIGVFVNAGFGAIMEKAEACPLAGVQLHGAEDPALVARLRKEGLVVVKALFANRAPWLSDAGRYRPSAFLAECAGGPLPGGNAKTWNWADARGLSHDHPLVLAGGLDARNVAAAIAAAAPAAVDVSSGVEASPGRKDPDKVRRFIRAVRNCPVGKSDGLGKIF